jgi:hypothetical protein
VAAGETEVVVVGDACGEREQADADADAEVVQGAGAVAFESEDALVVLMIDSIRWRMPEMIGAWPGSVLRLGRTIVAPNSAAALANSIPA